ncbi:ankyrin repeat domain-containing protein [Tunturibacter empetritectus]|uniref:Ankyrin repeat domain-containing protein n=1 Tax=Tunturiibacter empetritectus TaxID=3069691 RepID=A0AAU7Z983_9BACT
MPVRQLPAKPDLDHLKHQAKDLLRGHAEHAPLVAQQIREFHPRFLRAKDAEIFRAPFKLSDAQVTIAREHGFQSWVRLKSHIERPTLTGQISLPHHERIEDAAFRLAVKLIDAGDVAGLRSHLKQHPRLVHQHVVFEGGNYFRNPTLLEFVAENPVRHGSLPASIVEVAKVILDAGAERSAIEETLMLVCTGSVARECRVKLDLIDLLCDRGANPESALRASALHGEADAVNALIARGAQIDLPVAAALGRVDDFRRLLAASDGEDRHLALALASQYGQVEIVKLLLDAGEDPNRYNPVGGHSHTTPLHQAAGAGNERLVKLLVERGARLDRKDVLWRGTPADWARYGGKTEVERYLRSLQDGGSATAEGASKATTKYGDSSLSASSGSE